MRRIRSLSGNYEVTTKSLRSTCFVVGTFDISQIHAIFELFEKIIERRCALFVATDYHTSTRLARDDQVNSGFVARSAPLHLDIRLGSVHRPTPRKDTRNFKLAHRRLGIRDSSGLCRRMAESFPPNTFDRTTFSVPAPHEHPRIAMPARPRCTRARPSYGDVVLLPLQGAELPADSRVPTGLSETTLEPAPAPGFYSAFPRDRHRIW
jgi:hypothetical protein